MTRDEWRAGLHRLVVLVVGLTLLALAIGLGTHAADRAGDLRAQVGAGFALVGALLLLAGVSAFLGSGVLARDRDSVRGPEIRARSAEERRGREATAAGLLALGAVFLGATFVVR